MFSSVLALPPRENSPIFTFALLSIDIRNVALSSSAFWFLSLTLLKIESVSGIFFKGFFLNALQTII